MKLSLLMFFAICASMLSACSPTLKESLSQSLSGKDLNGRLQVLSSSCAEHARRHSGRIDSETGHLRLAEICAQLSSKIREASSNREAKRLQPVISGLVAECYVECSNVRYNATRTGATQRGYSTNKALLRQESELICQRYKTELNHVLATQHQTNLKEGKQP